MYETMQLMLHSKVACNCPNQALQSASVEHHVVSGFLKAGHHVL